MARDFHPSHLSQPNRVTSLSPSGPAHSSHLSPLVSTACDFFFVTDRPRPPPPRVGDAVTAVTDAAVTAFAVTNAAVTAFP